MKHIFTLITALLALFTTNAQVLAPNDSALTGTGNTQMVFYSLSTGYKTVSSDTDWHLAITVRPTQYPSAPL
ncbi:MAG TPA: hypothetical protein VG603_10000, partial [Chitinophagales bacterium]|nr:hypothetical protein [Chitinophagales bacterium]